MSAPFRTLEKSIPLEGMDTADSIMLGRLMSDDEIVAGFERQFDPMVISRAAELATAHLHAGIDAAYPDIAANDQHKRAQITHSGKAAPGNYEHLDRTMPPDEASLIAEPDITYEDKLRDFTLEEAKVVLAALRTAVGKPEYKREAQSILAERSPSRVERTARHTSLNLGKLATTIKTKRPYHGRHRA